VRRIRPLLLLLVLASLLPAVPARAARPAPVYGYIPMSDGVTLKYQVLLPDPDRWGDGPYQMVMDYSGYIPAQTIYDGLRDRFRESGYAVVGLNIRGSHCSGGYFDYFEPRQSLDGKEAIEYLTGYAPADVYTKEPVPQALQGKLGNKLAMVGKSYPGITQLFVAAQQPKGLAAIVPGHVFGDLYRDVPFPGGILNATFAGAWSGQRAAETMYSGWAWWAANQSDTRCAENQVGHIPNTPFNPFVQALYNQFDGPLFWERSPWYWADKIDVPTLLVESWQDEQVGSRATHLIERFRPGLPWKFLAANGDHGEYYGEQMLPHIWRFLEYTLRGSDFVPGNFHEVRGYEGGARNDWIAAMNFPSATAEEYWAEDRVIINFENGARGDRAAAWTETFSTWPPAETTPDRYTMRADGSLSTQPHPDAVPAIRNEAANARLAGAIDYVYAPYAGTQERGGQGVGVPVRPVDAVPRSVTPGDWTRKPPQGTFARFTTEALTEDKMMAGTGSVDLYVSSTAPDTDIEVTLTEVRPDGQEVFVQKGWLRASHRLEDPRYSTELRPFQSHKLGDSAPLIPGHPTLTRVEIFPFAHMFRAGSKIRVWVNAPNILPDLWGFAALPTTAVNTIYTSSFYPSSIALPVIAGRSARVAEYPACGSLRNQPCRPEA